jgi:hypothetical protein
MIALIAAEIGILVTRHGEPKTGHFNMWTGGLLGWAPLIGLLVWGGFWS